MTEAFLDIKKWGNNLGVRLPAAIAREAKQQMHMIWLDVEFHKMAALVFTKCTNAPICLNSNRTSQYPKPIFGGPDDMILAIPYRVR